MTLFKIRQLELNIQGKTQGRCLLSKVNLNIQTGHVMWLIGESGAGKSSLCNLLAGLVPDNAHIRGSLILNTETIEPGTTKGYKRLRRWLEHGQLAWAPQNPADTFPPTTPLARSFPHLDVAKPYLPQLGLAGDIWQRLPAELSGGQIARISLLAALQHTPDILVCDEPTAGLDSDNADHMIAALQQHAAKGHGVLAASHDLAALGRADTHQDQVAIMFAGHIIEVCPLANFLAAKAANIYARALANAAPNRGAVPLPDGFEGQYDAYHQGDEWRRLDA